MHAALVVLVWLALGWAAWVVIGTAAVATWLLRRILRGCDHDRRRCLHGDEIIDAGFRRGRCLDCGKTLPELPEPCSETGRPHGAAA